MDRRALSLQQVLEFVREFKRVITPRYSVEPKVYLYGSYAKGSANSDSDIDVAVIVAEGEITNKWEQWADLFGDVRKVSVLTEPLITIITLPKHSSQWLVEIVYLIFLNEKASNNTANPRHRK